MAGANQMKFEAYCMKCKKMVEIQNPKIITRKNGRKAVEGTCPYCGSKVSKFISAEEAEKLEKAA